MEGPWEPGPWEPEPWKSESWEPESWELGMGLGVHCVASGARSQEGFEGASGPNSRQCLQPLTGCQY